MTLHRKKPKMARAGGGLVASRAEQREEARLAALERDAARYRWLRIKCGLVPSAFGIGQVAMTLAGSTDDRDAKRLDAHIDTAMNGANNNHTPPSPHNAATDNTRDGGEE